MSAPTKPAVEAEQDTLPLPVSQTLPRGNGLSTERGVWLVPATVLAAIGTGLWARDALFHLRYEITYGGLAVVLLGCAVIIYVSAARRLS